MSLREEQCNKVCRILDDVLANRPTERDALIVATRRAFDALSEPHWIPVTERPDKSGDYLATLIDGAEKWVEIIYWNETFGGSWQAVIGDEECYSIIGNVIAWMPLPPVYQSNCNKMPLPEPYKGVTE